MSKEDSMELLPKEIEITLPKMYQTEKIVTSKKIQSKFKPKQYGREQYEYSKTIYNSNYTIKK